MPCRAVLTGAERAAGLEHDSVREMAS